MGEGSSEIVHDSHGIRTYRCHQAEDQLLAIWFDLKLRARFWLGRTPLTRRFGSAIIHARIGLHARWDRGRSKSGSAVELHS